jgi:hypothetical protein
MPGFKNNQDWLIRANYPKGWLWQGCPYIGAEAPVEIPRGQLVVPAQQRPDLQRSVGLAIAQAVAALAAEPPSAALIVLPQQRQPSPSTPVLGRVIMPTPGVPTHPITKHLIISKQPPGLRPTTPAVLSAGIAIVPEPVELLRAPLIIPAEPPPPTSPPTIHGGLTITQELPPRQQLIVAPPPRIIPSPSLLRGRAGEEIIIPRGQLIVPAQELPKTRPSIFRQWPFAPTAQPSTYWVPRGWVPEGWVPLPPAEEQAGSFGQTLIVSAAKQKPAIPATTVWSRSIPAPLVWPSRPLIAPAPEQPKTAQPNTLKWHTPPLEIVSLPLAQPLLVPAQQRPETKPSVLKAFIPPVAVVPIGQPLIVPGQPSSPLAKQELKWFTPEAIVPPSGQFLIVLPGLLPDYKRPRATHGLPVKFPIPTIPPINAQLIVQALPITKYQQSFAILGGESLTIPPLITAQLSLSLLVYEADAEFVFSREADSTL